MGKKSVQEIACSGKVSLNEVQAILNRWGTSLSPRMSITDPLDNLSNINSKVSFLALSLCGLESNECPRGLTLLLGDLDQEIGAVVKELDDAHGRLNAALENVLGDARIAIMTRGATMDVSDTIQTLVEKRAEISAHIDEVLEVAGALNLR